MINPDYVRKDAIVWDNEKYQYHDDTKRALPMLDYFGIEVYGAGENLWSSEFQYKIQTRQLYVTEIKMLENMKKPYKTIGGVEPKSGKYFIEYKNLLERLPFTGRIMMGQPFITINGRLWNYKILKVVHCIKGDVKEILDLSDLLKQTITHLNHIDSEYKTKNRKKSRYSKLFDERRRVVFDRFWSQVYGSEPRNLKQ